MIDIERTIISQYANSPTLVQLIQNMNQYLDPMDNFQQFFDMIWNVDTAQGLGLDIWGRIVGVGRQLQIPDTNHQFRFLEEDGGTPFGSFPFRVDGPTSSNTYTLSDASYRTLIMVKALSNISSTTGPAMNQILNNLFAGRGRCYVNDTGHMRFRYMFEFLITPLEYAIITQSNAMIRPAGVGYELLSTTLPCFGFSEAGPESSAPFDSYPFVPSSEPYYYATV